MDKQKNDFPILETERLYLKKCDIKYASEFYELAKNPNVTKFVTWECHKNIDVTKEYIDTLIKEDTSKSITWAIISKHDNCFIGLIGLIFETDHKTAVAGYWIGEPYWKKGYMTESFKTVIDYGFANKDINRLEAVHLIDNIPSGMVMTKCGLQYEGTLKQYLYCKDTQHDCKIYSITRDEWSFNKK